MGWLYTRDLRAPTPSYPTIALWTASYSLFRRVPLALSAEYEVSRLLLAAPYLAAAATVSNALCVAARVAVVRAGRRWRAVAKSAANNEESSRTISGATPPTSQYSGHNAADSKDRDLGAHAAAAAAAHRSRRP